MCEDTLEPLRWSVDPGSGGAAPTVTLVGELDMDQVGTVAALADELTAGLAGGGSGVAVPGVVAVDCSGLSFIDSSGYVALIMLARQVADAGSSLALRNVPAHMVRSHSLLGLDGVLPLDG